ncbi:MAG TPA: amidohydrolase family protein [Vicinamibacterales bacterium]|nr:amidohydrolase family protein [Vicinamibacterales bacterium]
MGEIATARRTVARVLWAVTAAAVATTVAGQGQSGAGIRDYVKVDAPIVALTNVRVIDGTGAPAKENQTIVIQNGDIAALGDSSTLSPPAGATVIDLAGKTVIPGLVMVHEHLYYPTGPQVYGQLGQSFTRLYLAGGVTTMRTGGNVNGFMDLNLKRLIDGGQQPGPSIDATAPYLNGPNSFLQMHALENADDARRQVAYWADMGATSFKAYMNITRDELGAAVGEAHARGFKITGHLCSITYQEAADLGIDNLEHGFLAATDFVGDKKPDVCPGQARGQQTIAALDENGEPFKALVRKLIAKNVTLTSTLTIFETFTPGRPLPPGLDVLAPQLKEQFEKTHARTAQNTQSNYLALFPKAMQLERAFVRAGGQLIAGTDPTGGGGVVPGYSNQRQVELLVEAGFTPLEAITIATLNGAKYLRRDARVGSVAAGKQADLVVLNGNPAAAIADVRNVEIVFKRGVGFDPVKLVESVKGRVGIW